MKNNKLTLILGLILLTINLGSILGASANFSVDMTIEDAWYADLDNDSYTDDIAVVVLLELYNYNYITSVDVYIGVELPSGTTYWFTADLSLYKTTYYGYLEITFHLLNTATETGWYTAKAVGFADGETLSIMHSYDFDPPGETNGGDPVGIYFT